MVSQDDDDEGEGDLPDRCEVEALWDTGSTHTIISQSVVDACELQPTGMVMLLEGVGDGGSEDELPLCPTYPVRLMFPDHGETVDTQVAAIPNVPGVDVLLGMDFISKGDLLITNLRDTRLSFRAPPRGTGFNDSSG